MTGRKLPKFPKRLKFPKTNNSTPQALPTTFEEFHDAALEDEESGDRFKLSDLVKSLRFYNFAYQKYQKAQTLDGNDIDNLYNLHCLVYGVWDLYRNSDFSILELGDVQGFEILGFDIHDIKRMYDHNVFRLLNEYNGDRFVKVSDFCFNLIVVNLNILELDEDGQLDIVNDCLKLFEMILKFQNDELDKFMNDLKQAAAALEEFGSSATPQGDTPEIGNGEKIEYETVEQVTPDTVLDTLVEAYKMISIFLENSTSINELRHERSKVIAQFKVQIDEILNSLITMCQSNLYELNQKTLYEIKILNHSILTLLNIDNYDDFLSFWNSINLPDNYDWKLAFVDNLSTFVGFHESEPTIDTVITLNKSNELLREVENVLKEKLKPSQSSDPSQSLEISAHLIRLVNCLINRSDNELTKYQISQNPVNLTNSTNILKTALNYLNSINCGLRETMVNKCVKKRLKRQIWVRLIILEDEKVDLQKIKDKIGERFYQEDLMLLQSNADVYNQLFSSAGN